jgi:hypothetical protein
MQRLLAMREMCSATVCLVVADHYPMDLKTSTDFPGLFRIWRDRGKVSAGPAQE